ncbi:hypothetical protein ALI22I_34925 [Saccharothrix sp. ALI-22-I]|uniref:hypothetical protein n=1 Tax=Saccharothrix sp. ALI-22-I TaxID=1933778 RepID=UPI00097C0B69|nr:hypothetical protein [Saccharothrix sp. ALI-22-I]ONI83663.1 hypothetical protein ALI22I_34925 [Saccharothrix sp. ALI-22-I]
MTGFQVLDLAADSDSGSVASTPREPDTLEADLGVLSADLDPLGLLTTAGLGWLTEHVDFLREPLDWLAGHGDRFEDAVATWKQVATTLGGIARRRAGGGRLAVEMAAMSLMCLDVASHVAAAGRINAAIQGVFRDLIAMFVWEVVRNATIALAAVEISSGTSLSAFAAWAVERGAVVLDRITGQLVALVGVMARILSALKALFGKARDMLKAITRFGEDSGPQPVRATFQRRTGYLDD